VPKPDNKDLKKMSSQLQAHEKAIDKATNTVWSQGNAEYEVDYIEEIVAGFLREMREKTDTLLKEQMKTLNITVKDLTRQSTPLSDTVMWRGLPILNVEYKGTGATIRYAGSKALSKLATEIKKEELT
jgi:hypothetical protein